MNFGIDEEAFVGFLLEPRVDLISRDEVDGDVFAIDATSFVDFFEVGG